MRSLGCGATGIAAEQLQIAALIQVPQHIWTSRQFGEEIDWKRKKKTLLTPKLREYTM